MSSQTQSYNLSTAGSNLRAALGALALAQAKLETAARCEKAAGIKTTTFETTLAQELASRLGDLTETIGIQADDRTFQAKALRAARKAAR